MNRRLGYIGLGVLLACEPSPRRSAADTILTQQTAPRPPEFNYLLRLSAQANITSLNPDSVPLEAALTEAVERNSPDAFLIDYSGSMNGPASNSSKSKISVVSSYQFPATADLLGFGMHVKAFAPGTAIDRLPADGGTPMYNSLSELLEHQAYKKILVLTDGEDTMHDVTPGFIIGAANKSGTCILYLAVGVKSAQARQNMNSINAATCTGADKNQFLDE